MASSPDLLSAPVSDVLRAIGSDARTPAGGSVTALTVGMAAALLEMAAASRPEWPEAAGARAQAESLRLRAERLAYAVAEAYEEALARLEVPSGSKPEVRDFALGEALARAADVPLEIAATAADAAALGTVVAEHADPRHRADAVVAVLLAGAAARAAASLVEVNLTTVADDARLGAARRHVDDAARAVVAAVHAEP